MDFNSLAILFLIITRSVFVFAVTCSSSNRIWDSDETLEKNQLEIDYYLKKNQIYKSIISPKYTDGYSMRIGQTWDEYLLTSIYHVVECERLTGEDVYREEFKTKTYFYGKSPEFAYTFISKEVWSCTTKSDCSDPKTNNHPIKFYRIVNKVHGVRPIHEIYFFDGIEVVQDTCSDQARQDNENIWTATVKEIKYIDPLTNKVWRYDGKLVLKKDYYNNDQLDFFVPVDVIEQQVKQIHTFPLIYVEERLESIKEQPKTQNIGLVGEILRVGKKSFTTLGREDDEAICELQLSDNPSKELLLLTEENLPDCYLRRKPITGRLEDFVDGYGSEGGKVNRVCFSVINQEIWKCTYNDNQKGKGSVQKTFTRRVTELVGAIPIAKIEYYGAVSVWKYELDNESSSVKIREIYYHGHKIEDQLRFNGLVKLKKQKIVGSFAEQAEAKMYQYNAAAPHLKPDFELMTSVKKQKARIDPASDYYVGRLQSYSVDPHGTYNKMLTQP